MSKFVMNYVTKGSLIVFILLITLISCCFYARDPIDLGIVPSQNADAGSSYTNSNNVDIHLDYYSLPSPAGAGDLRDAIAYLDANGDDLTDVFVATGDFQLQGEVDSILAINDGAGVFNASTAEFNDNMPPANHARKSIVGDFNNDGLDDIFVFDHGYDGDRDLVINRTGGGNNNFYEGRRVQLLLNDGNRGFSDATSQIDNPGSDSDEWFPWIRAQDIDNDGDIDFFPDNLFLNFKYINDGLGNFTKVE